MLVLFPVLLLIRCIVFPLYHKTNKMKLSVVLATSLSVVGTVAWDCNDSKSNHFLRVPSQQPGKALIRLTSRRDINKDKFSSNQATVWSLSLIHILPSFFHAAG